MFTGRFGPAGSSAEVLFDRICAENGIRHLLTAPRSPTTTGKVERWHKTMRAEFLAVHDRVKLTGVVGIYTDPRHVIHYTSNDEVRQEFTVVYRGQYVSGEPTTSSETTQVKWVPVDQVTDLKMDRSQRMRLEWALAQQGTWIDPTGD